MSEVWILTMDGTVVSVHETEGLAEVAWGEMTEAAATDDEFERMIAGALRVDRWEVEEES